MRVLIVDDHPLFRAGLKALLFELDPSIETAEATSVADVIQASERGETFDLVLLDLDLPDAKGLSGLQRVHAAFERPQVVVMSAVEDSEVTVRSHVGSILQTLGVDSRLRAVVVAYQAGLCDG